jgi:hypothetical protein
MIIRSAFWLTMFFCFFIWASYAFAGCGINQRTEIASNDPLTMNVCASVTAYCDTGSDHVPCEDIPVFELTEADMEEPEPYTAADVAAWREIETAGGE